MDNNKKQPPHHLETEWISEYQNYLIEDGQNVPLEWGSYESRFNRWKKDIKAKKHAPLTSWNLKQRQIRLDADLSKIEDMLVKVFKWIEKQKQLEINEKHQSLGLWDKIKCWWWGKRGFDRYFQLVYATNVLKAAPLNDWYQEAFLHFNIDLDKLLKNRNDFRNELRDLFWDAIFTNELKRELRANKEGEIKKLKELQEKRKLQEEERKQQDEERKVQEKNIENRETILANRYKRSDMLVREKDYKRGNTLDNYFRNHLIDQIFSAFDNSCYNCGSSENLALDHWVIPKNEGGNFVICRSDTRKLILNVVVLCTSCNSSKGEKRPVDWCGVEKAEEAEIVLRKLLDDLWQIPSFRKVVTKWYELDLFDLLLEDLVD